MKSVILVIKGKSLINFIILLELMFVKNLHYA